jgi:hypothetical protein
MKLFSMQQTPPSTQGGDASGCGELKEKAAQKGSAQQAAMQSLRVESGGRASAA